MKTLHQSSKAFIAALLSIGLLLVVAVGTASAAPAHAKVLSATPAIGSTIATAPTTISVITAENMKPGAANSNLFVYGPSGALISQGDAKVALNNPKSMSVAIKPEKDGIYVVRWITVSSDDGDPDQGAFVFTVKAAAAAAPAPTPAAHASSGTTTASSSGSAPILPLVIAAIVALLVGLGAGFGLGRGRASSTAAADATSASSEHETAPTGKP
jgi:methionine-rich copper-binding protein CopC